MPTRARLKAQARLLLYVACSLLLGCFRANNPDLSGSVTTFAYSSLVDQFLWTAYDPGAHSVGVDPDGFVGGAFDGRFLYFAPWYNGTDGNGEVLRLDTQADFGTATSWLAYNPGANGVGTNPKGYRGTTFDGRYVYFAPHSNGIAYHGEVLRYDTQGNFSVPGSWQTYNPGANGVGAIGIGFQGAVFDGRYVYLVPWSNGANYHGEVMRYDTQGSFTTAGSWQAYNPSANGLGTNPIGYAGGVYIGRYVLFVPYHNATVFHGEVLRYDSQGSFTSLASWSSFDANANGVGSDPTGYAGAVFDGRFVYFSPQHTNSGFSGEVLRYDSQGAFTTASNWQCYDPGAHGVGSNPRGFQGATYDGRFVYFAPNYNGVSGHGEIMRYDTAGNFSVAASWQTFNPGLNGVGVDPRGYGSAAFDGRYVYLIPQDKGSAASVHGEFLRFDAKSPPEMPSTISGGSSY